MPNHTPTTSSQRPGLQVGDTLDKYQIVAQLGAGGASIVWKGHDKLLDEFVAIKQLLPDIAGGGDDALRERFRHEAAIQKQVSLNARHVVRVLDLIDEPRGLFIVMEFIDGQSLEQLMSQSGKPMPQRDALGFVAATAVALESIHAHNVVHRDLKPSNILLPRGGGLKVSDFGLAALLGDQESLSVGSVRYMAPEMFTDDPADGRADIYSLGIMAYEMLAGRALFNDAFKVVLRDQRNQAMRWMKWHTNARAAVPPLAKLNPAVSGTLSDLVARMMHKDRDQRVGSASQLLAAIQRHFVAGDKPAPARTSEAPAAASATTAAVMEHTAPLPRPRRWPWVVAAVLLLSLFAGAGKWTHDRRQQRAVTRQQINDARDALTAAIDTYSRGEHAAALTQFEALAAQWPTTTQLGGKAAGYAALSRGQLAMQAEEYEAALAHLRDADASQALDSEPIDVRLLIDEAGKRLGFAREVARIEQAIAGNRIGEARQILGEQSGYKHNPQEEQILMALAARIAGEANAQTVERALNSAQEMASRGEREQAIQFLEQARLRHRSPRINERIEQLRRDIAFEAAVAEADRAEAAGRLSDAVLSLTAASALKADESLQRRIQQLRGRDAFEQGRAAEQAGDSDAALAAYTRAAGFDFPAARQALARLQSSNQKAAFVRAGDDALSSRDYLSAIQQYQNALQMGDDPQVQSRLTTARVRLEVDRGAQLLSQGDLAGAQAAFDRAREMAPDDRAANQGLADMNLRRQYLQLLTAGDSLRARGKFGEAKGEYFKAQRLIKTEEVAQRLEETEHEDLVAKARFYMETTNWNAASAMLQAAARIQRSEEVQQMLAEVARHTGGTP